MLRFPNGSLTETMKKKKKKKKLSLNKLLIQKNPQKVGGRGLNLTPQLPPMVFSMLFMVF